MIEIDVHLKIASALHDLTKGLVIGVRPETVDARLRLRVFDKHQTGVKGLDLNSAKTKALKVR